MCHLLFAAPLVSLPLLWLPWPWGAGLYLLINGPALALGYLALRAQCCPVVTGVEGLVGREAEALTPFGREGSVRVRGEIWSARSSLPVEAGQKVVIRRLEGLQLEVEPLKDGCGRGRTRE